MKHDAAKYAHHQFNLDVLKAIPVTQSDPESDFIKTRLPQIQKTADEKRQKFRAMMDRRIQQFGQDAGAMRF